MAEVKNFAGETVAVFGEPEPKSIFQLIPLVARDCGAVGADGVMGGNAGYRFRKLDDLLNALHPVLVRHGVFMAPNRIAENRIERESNGKFVRIIELTVTFHIYGPTGDYIEVTTAGEGQDWGDKGANKAMSAAYKYAWFQTLCVPTVDILKDSEDSDDGKKMILPSPEQTLVYDPEKETGQLQTEEQTRAVINLSKQFKDLKGDPKTVAVAAGLVDVKASEMTAMQAAAYLGQLHMQTVDLVKQKDEKKLAVQRAALGERKSDDS